MLKATRELYVTMPSGEYSPIGSSINASPFTQGPSRSITDVNGGGIGVVAETFSFDDSSFTSTNFASVIILPGENSDLASEAERPS